MAEMKILRVPAVAGALFRAFPEASPGDVLRLLNSASLGKKKLDFLYSNRFLVRCPVCRKHRVNLYMMGGYYACADCHGVTVKKRSPKRRTTENVVYARYVRPLRKLAALEEKLLKPRLSFRRRRAAERRVRRLRGVIPEYALLIRDALMSPNSTQQKNFL